MEDSQIVAMLFARAESALDEVSQKYSHLYRQILRNILSDAGETEECEDDLLLAVWNSIPPNRPDSLCTYIATLARRIGIDRLRYRTRKKRDTGYFASLSELEECLPDESIENKERSREIQSILEAFIGSLAPDVQVLFIRRYVFFESVSSLAKRFALSENLVSVKLYRARAALRKKLREEGIWV